jgi:hypothetical protein
MNLCFDDDGIQNVSSNAPLKERTTTIPSAKRERERENESARKKRERKKEQKTLKE